MKHGRAVMPFGKHRGVRIRNLPDDYLSWLIGEPWMREDKWHWLLESIAAEFRFRGLKWDTVAPEPGFRELMASLFDSQEPQRVGERKVRMHEE